MASSTGKYGTYSATVVSGSLEAIRENRKGGDLTFRVEAVYSDGSKPWSGEIVRKVTVTDRRGQQMVNVYGSEKADQSDYKIPAADAQCLLKALIDATAEHAS